MVAGLLVAGACSFNAVCWASALASPIAAAAAAAATLLTFMLLLRFPFGCIALFALLC
jgi:hypothetical protein